MGTGFKVWFLTAFLNAFYSSIADVVAGRSLNIFWPIFIFFITCIVLIPMMILFMELLKPGKGRQYTPAARMALLAFWFSGLVALFCMLLNFLFYSHFTLEGEIAVLTGTTIAAWITTVLLYRQSLLKVAVPQPPPPPMPRNFQGSIEDLPSAKIRIR